MFYQLVYPQKSLVVLTRGLAGHMLTRTTSTSCFSVLSWRQVVLSGRLAVPEHCSLLGAFLPLVAGPGEKWLFRDCLERCRGLLCAPKGGSYLFLVKRKPIKKFWVPAPFIIFVGTNYENLTFLVVPFDSTLSYRMSKLYDKIEKSSSSNDSTAILPTDGAASASQAAPLFPDVITPEVHDTLCTTFGVGVRKDAKANTLKEKIPQEGMEFAEWWLEFWKNKTEEQWKRKLRCLGAPLDVYEKATKEELGTIFFRFIDEDCTFSTVPLR